MQIQLHIIVLVAITGGLLLTGVPLLVIYYRLRRPDFSVYHTHTGLGMAGWVTTGVALFMLIPTAFVLAPFNVKYWVLTQHEGTIASISNRFVDGSGDLSGSTYTITLEGDQTPRVVNDSRILGLAVGDQIDLTCSLGWVYGGADLATCYMRSF